MAPGGYFLTISFFKNDYMEEESLQDDSMKQQQQQYIPDEIMQQQYSDSLVRTTRPNMLARQAVQQA